MGRDPPFKFPHKSRRCRHFDDEGIEKRHQCDFSSADCWFAHPDDPEWYICRTRHMGGKVPKGPAADMERYGGRGRSGAWSRSRSRERSWSRERGRDQGWGERGRQYPSRSRSPPRRRPDSLASSHASAVHGPMSPGHLLRESRRASVNYNTENNHSPLTSAFAVQASPVLSLPPPSPAQPPPVPPPPLPPPPPPTPGSPVQLFTPIQRIRPEVTTLERTATASSLPTTAIGTFTVPQPPVVTSTTTTERPDAQLAPPPEHSSLSPAIPGLTSSTKQPSAQEKMSVTSLEEGQVAEIPPPLKESGTRAASPSAPSPKPPLLPVPTPPSFARESTPVTEISQEAKIDMWNKRIQTFAELLAYKDRIQGLEADINDFSRYTTSSTFAWLKDGSEEKERIQSNLDELISDRDAAIRDMQKGFDELAIGSTSSDTTGAEWPSPLDIAEAQKKNDKVKEYVVGLADVMKEVSLTLKGLEELMERGDDGRKKREATRRSEKGKEKEALSDDAMDIEEEEVPTAEAASSPEGQRNEDEGAAIISDTSSSSSSSSRSLELSKIRAKFEVMETSIQNVAISLDQTESSWMQGVKELFQDLVLKQKKSVRKHVGKHKQLIEQHATQLKSSLGQVSDSVGATNVKMQNVADETSQAIEKINQLERERDSLLEGHKKFFEEELPELKKSFEEYEAQRAEDRNRMDALEAALNAFINRPPREPRNLHNGALAIQTPTPTTPTLHPPTPPTSSLTFLQSYPSSSTIPASSSSSTSLIHPPAPSSYDASYLLQNIKPILISLLREAVKPLLEEVRQKLEELVSEQKKEIYTNVWSKIQLTWQILGKIQQKTETDPDILNKANTAAPIAGRAGSDGLANFGEKEKERGGGGGVNGRAY